MARLLDGRVLARSLGRGLRQRIAALPRPPGLAVLRVGDDPASQVYVEKKTRRAQALGFHDASLQLPAEVSQDTLLAHIDTLNADPLVDGVLVQLPLPSQIDARAVLDRVDPAKDVDGFHPVNMGLMAQGRPRLVPCTPAGVMHMLVDSGVALDGARAVVLGRSNIVGRPLAMLLEHAHATVTLCHSHTRDLPDIVRQADVLIAAVGRPRMVQGDWIKAGAVVIDVGIHRLPDGGLCGDVDTDAAALRASAITPVPGGVGPLTIAMLMHNTVRAAELRLGL